MKTTVIYHSADYDGIFCREIARKFMPDAELIGWNFGDPPIPTDKIEGSRLIIMDLPTDKPFGWPMPLIHVPHGTITWIDHHKSAIESHPKDIPGYRIDGVAACRLAWQWFSLADKSWKEGDGAKPPNPNGGFYVLPHKEDFIDRKVSEPLAVRLAGEYDVWDKRDERVDVFQYGLRFVDQGSDFWEALLSIGEVGDKAVQDLLGHGSIAQRYSQKIDSDLVLHKSYRMKWEGLDWCVINTGRFNSLTFAAVDKPEYGHDALMGFMFNGKVWTVSMYHANHRKDLDLSLIAVKHGGGGHKGACGFTCKELPFELK